MSRRLVRWGLWSRGRRLVRYYAPGSIVITRVHLRPRRPMGPTPLYDWASIPEWGLTDR